MRPVFPALDLFHGDRLLHEHACEWEATDQILRDNPTITHLVWKDLRAGSAPAHEPMGRPGVGADVALRAALIKQLSGFSYEELAFHAADSLTYRRFLGFAHPLEVPRKSALAYSIKRISAQTWEKINHVLTHL